MDIWNIIALAIIQGLTEFLPISSSAHLILFPQIMGQEDQGLAFDVAVHFGSLLAVLIYFRHDLKPLLLSWLKSIQTRQLTAESRLVWGIFLGTIPVAVFGLLILVLNLENDLRSAFIIATATIFFAVLLWLADIMGKQKRDELSLTGKDILIIGLAQAVALIPGTSRSGITITAALALGLTRKAAARFSFLLAIPVIILAGAVETIKLVQQTDILNWYALILGFTFSALSAYICIYFFISLLDRISMLPFVIYRILLGIALFIWVVVYV
ncbi:MAG: undecaprenyl-diphosphate phosphatase [Thiomargarita sp.]|nr:undecaprenyl-diphosphate phosphatase [Thiomargarita sp.]